MMRTPRFGEALVCCRLVFFYGAAGCVCACVKSVAFCCNSCFSMNQDTAVEWRPNC